MVTVRIFALVMLVFLRMFLSGTTLESSAKNFPHELTLQKGSSFLFSAPTNNVGSKFLDFKMFAQLGSR